MGGWAFSYFRFPRSDAHQSLPWCIYSCGGVGRRSRTWFSPLTSRRRPASYSHRTTSLRYGICNHRQSDKIVCLSVPSITATTLLLAAPVAPWASDWFVLMTLLACVVRWRRRRMRWAASSCSTASPGRWPPRHASHAAHGIKLTSPTLSRTRNSMCAPSSDLVVWCSPWLAVCVQWSGVGGHEGDRCRCRHLGTAEDGAWPWCWRPPMISCASWGLGYGLPLWCYYGRYSFCVYPEYESESGISSQTC